MGENRKTVAVIGAGIVGVSTAIWLLRDGHDVILIDRKGPGEGTSHGNAGLLASSGLVPVNTPGILGKAPKMLLNRNEPLFLKWSYLPRLMPWLLPFLRRATLEDVRHRARALLPIIGDSVNDHQALAEGTGADPYIVPCDYMALYRDRAAYEADGLNWQIKRDGGFDWRELEGEAVAGYDPALAGENRFAACMPGHGRITDPGRYVKALAAHAEGQGARIIVAAVDDIVHENGRVTGLRAGGDTIACDVAVVTAGAWSKTLAGKLGLRIPLETERGYHLEFWGSSVMPKVPCMVTSGKFVMTPMDGRLRLAGIVELGGLDAPPSRAPFELLERNARAALPGLTFEKRVEWMGHRPSMPDQIPVIGAVPGVTGAYLGFGHDHVGLTGGPKTGRILAQMIGGKTPNLDLSPYAPDRFA